MTARTTARAAQRPSRELRAAGITDPQLVAGYRECRGHLARAGRTYYLSSLLLPPARRPFVQAMYGLARYADDIVDNIDERDAAGRAAALTEFEQRFTRDLAAGGSTHPIIAAAVDTIDRCGIDHATCEAFFTSMRMDLTVTEYADFTALMTYVYGSASVIGLQMVPVLGVRPGGDAERARRAAADLGTAFQLANFIRDVGEDLDRGRLYLPLDELAAAGLTRAELEQRRVDERVRALLSQQIDRVRALSDAATAGIDDLEATSRPCVRAAQELYVGIVDEVEAIDYQVFDRRARTSRSRRARVAGRAWFDGMRARRRG